MSCRDAYHVRDFITDSAFSRPSSHDPTTFTTNPRVVGSDTGSAPVEYLHNLDIMVSKFTVTVQSIVYEYEI